MRSWMRLRRMRSRSHQPHLDHLFNRQAYRQRAVHFHALHLGNLSMLGEHPELFQNFVQLFFVGKGENFLRRDLAMMQLDAPVGQPRDRNPAAAFALYDTVAREITYCRVPYDVEAAAQRIREQGLPLWLAERLLIGR